MASLPTLPLNILRRLLWNKFYLSTDELISYLRLRLCWRQWIELEKVSDWIHYIFQWLTYQLEIEERKNSINHPKSEFTFGDISAAECCREHVYLKNLIEELTSKKINATMNINNQSAINLIRKGNFNRKSKHINVRFHYRKENVETKMINIRYFISGKQIADLLMQALGPNKFECFKKMIAYFFPMYEICFVLEYIHCKTEIVKIKRGCWESLYQCMFLKKSSSVHDVTSPLIVLF